MDDRPDDDLNAAATVDPDADTGRAPEATPAPMDAIWAWINENRRLPRSAPPRGPTQTARADLGGDGDACVQAAIEAELEHIANAAAGRRNDNFYLTALSIGRFVAAGRLDARDVEPLLVDAAIDAGLPRAEAERTVIGAFQARLLDGAP